MTDLRNYRTEWCATCQEDHRPTQRYHSAACNDTLTKVFHTDPFGTRYIPEISDQRCIHCGWFIQYDRTWGGWVHYAATGKQKQCVTNHGRIGEPPSRLSPWDITRQNSEAYENWKMEVSNGDTLRSFAEYLEEARQDAY